MHLCLLERCPRISQRQRALKEKVKEQQFNTGDDIVVNVDDDGDDCVVDVIVDDDDDYQSRTPGQALLRTLHMVRQADKS